MFASRLCASVAALGLLAALGCSSSQAAATNYSLAVESPKHAKVGEAARAVVRVVPKNPWKVNLKYPIRLKLQPPAGVEVAKAELTAGDAQVSEKEAKFEVGYTLKEAGSKTVSGELKFSVCVSDKCDIKKEAVSWTTSAR
ncbi:MAG: hypothetical protein HY906_02290 [Deltaproteobacteria bacterium]|nr:hypothetical protein [Deltaproteobacteria bacterium]